MTTAQEVLTNSFPPFPFFVENPVDLPPRDLPANNNQLANDHQVVERQKGVPVAPLLAHENVHIDANPLPGRCQFTFSDGRQCAMPRSDIHPSLCRFHSEREDQLFGEPGSRTVGASLDLPELFSASRDLTTAAGVNRALGQVFRLLAQRRISRQEAATFAHLAQLLLRSISLARAESASAFSERATAAAPALSPIRETLPAPILPAKTPYSGGALVQHSHPVDHASGVVTLSESESADERSSGFDSRTVLRECSPGASPQRKNGADSTQSPPSVAHASIVPRAFARRELDSQVAHNEHFHELRSQLAQDEHLQNCET